jgi:chitin disaccharide deacetylase
MKSSKKLILNADDYGLCPEVNEAVEMIAAAGRLGGASILVNGKSFDQAINFLQKNQHLSAGIHLNVIEGKPSAPIKTVPSLLGADHCFLGFRGLMQRWILHPVRVKQEIEIEWRAQIVRLQSARINISHADSHQHFHAFPFAYSIALRLCEEFKIPFLRLPNEQRKSAMRGASSIAIRASLKAARFIAPASKIRHNDHFLGFERAGNYDLPALLEDVKSLREGVTELALHPGVRDNFPYAGLRGRSELMAVLDQKFVAALSAESVELTSWNNV